MRPYSNRSQRGFSLMEILIAVAIISIILGMTMLNYSTLLPNYKANSAMDQLLYQLRSARERAISHRREVQVQFVGTNQLTVTEIWLVGTAPLPTTVTLDRKSTRLNSSHGYISYAVFCLKKKKNRLSDD